MNKSFQWTNLGSVPGGGVGTHRNTQEYTGVHMARLGRINDQFISLPEVKCVTDDISFPFFSCHARVR
jgi:hypothetical protein